MPDEFHFDDYVVSRLTWTLQWRGNPIPLARKTFDLLLYLIDHRPQVVGKDALLEALWPNQVVEESNLTQQIFLLRKALSRNTPGVAAPGGAAPGSEAPGAKIIQTVAGRGYRFSAEVHAIAPPMPSATPLVGPAAKPVATPAVESLATPAVESLVTPAVESLVTPAAEPSVAPAPSSTPWAPQRQLPAPRPWWLRRRIMGGCLLLGACVASGLYAWTAWQSRSNGPPVAVVLADFGDTTGDPALDRGLNDAIRIDLSQSPFLTVLPTSKVQATMAAMREPSDAPVTASLAREVCERNSAQVLLQGAVRQFGQRYLVSLRANSCLSGDLLAESKDEVSLIDDLPRSFDRLAARVRRQLGESRASIKRFDTPLFASSTASLPALKSYSEAKRLMVRGEMAAALPLYQRAVELDPNFGAAYLDLASAYHNLDDIPHAQQAISKAYTLRATVSEPVELSISAFYNYLVTEDLDKSAEVYRTWTSLYPNNDAAKTNLANVYYLLGRSDRGVEPATQSLALDPASVGSYHVLAVVQFHSGRLAEAKHTIELAFAHHFDTPDLHEILLQVDYALHDEAGVAAETAWGHAHQGAVWILDDEIHAALSRGEARHAGQLVDGLVTTAQPPELAAATQGALSELSRQLADAGLNAESLRVLKAIPPEAQDGEALIALAEDGRALEAREGLQRQARQHATSTMWKNLWTPQIDAALLLAEHKPAAAIQALEPARAFDMLSLGPAYLRGEAYVALDQIDAALGEFRKITQHPYVDPLVDEIPLAVLATARAYDRQNQAGKALDAYRQFFDLWKTADPDQPLLLAAHAEMDHLLAASH